MDTFELPPATDAEPGEDFKALMARNRAERQAAREQQRAEAEAKQAEAARLEADRQAKLANSPVEVGKRKLAEQAKQRREEVRRRVAKFRSLHNEKKLKEMQAINLAKLPDVERQSLLDQKAECTRLLAEIADCMKGIAEGRVAGLEPPDDPNGMAWPDERYREVRSFIERHGLTKDWVPSETLTRLTAEEIDGFSDRAFTQFGLRTLLPDFIFFEFVRAVDQWASVNPGECDEDIEHEVRRITEARNNVPPVHEHTQGYSQLELDRQRDSRTEGERILADWNAEWNRNFMREMNKSRGMEVLNEQPSL